MKKRIDFDKINNAALSVFPAVLQRLLPDGKAIMGEWSPRNPRRNDRKPGSFKINMRSGVWRDFATGDGGSDPVSLVAYIEDISQVEAARRLAAMLGIEAEA